MNAHKKTWQDRRFYHDIRITFTLICHNCGAKQADLSSEGVSKMHEAAKDAGWSVRNSGGRHGVFCQSCTTNEPPPLNLQQVATHLSEGKSIGWLARHYGCTTTTIGSRIRKAAFKDKPELLDIVRRRRNEGEAVTIRAIMMFWSSMSVASRDSAKV
jgi:hypothetical protein